MQPSMNMELWLQFATKLKQEYTKLTLKERLEKMLEYYLK